MARVFLAKHWLHQQVSYYNKKRLHYFASCRIKNKKQVKIENSMTSSRISFPEVSIMKSYTVPFPSTYILKPVYPYYSTGPDKNVIKLS